MKSGNGAEDYGGRARGAPAGSPSGRATLGTRAVSPERRLRGRGARKGCVTVKQDGVRFSAIHARIQRGGRGGDGRDAPLRRREAEQPTGELPAGVAAEAMTRDARAAAASVPARCSRSTPRTPAAAILSTTRLLREQDTGQRGAGARQNARGMFEYRSRRLPSRSRKPRTSKRRWGAGGRPRWDVLAGGAYGAFRTANFCQESAGGGLQRIRVRRSAGSGRQRPRELAGGGLQRVAESAGGRAQREPDDDRAHRRRQCGSHDARAVYSAYRCTAAVVASAPAASGRPRGCALPYSRARARARGGASSRAEGSAPSCRLPQAAARCPRRRRRSADTAPRVRSLLQDLQGHRTADERHPRHEAVAQPIDRALADARSGRRELAGGGPHREPDDAHADSAFECMGPACSPSTKHNSMVVPRRLRGGGM